MSMSVRLEQNVSIDLNLNSMGILQSLSFFNGVLFEQ